MRIGRSEPQHLLGRLAVQLLTIVCLLSFCASCRKESSGSGSSGGSVDVAGASSVVQEQANSPQGSSTEPNPTSDRPLQEAPVNDREFVGPLADAYRRLDPLKDGWDTEAVSAQIQAQLGKFAKQIESESQRPEDWQGVVDSSIATSPIVPENMDTVFEEGGLVVKRGRDDSSIARHVGMDGFLSSLEGFRSLLSGDSPPHLKFKLYRVSRVAAGDTQVEAILHADRTKPTGSVEITSTWRCVWTGEPEPKLKRLEVKDFEVVERRDAPGPLFADCTQSLLQSEASYSNQLLHSTDHWRARLCRDLGLDVVANHGLALGDVNGDMLEDIYICQQGGLPNRLYLQRPNGTLRDVTATCGANWLDYCASALIVDLDQDGDRDLVVGQEVNVVLMMNDGKGKFEVARSIPTKAQVFSMSAADFDLDGDLDLFVTGYNPLNAKARTGVMGEPIPYHDAQNGGENLLLRNNGDWNFNDVTADVGLDENNHRFSFAVAWEDYDNDGDVDLYVANDYGRNSLYENRSGHFKDVAKSLGVEDMSAGMAVSWSDFDRDGWMDLYVSNMFSAAGNRITFQRQFQTEIDEQTKKGFQRHARGNSLFKNDGGKRFQDVSVAGRVTMGRWAWGNRFVDFNNDGWEDLVVANGFISTPDTGDL